MMDVRAEEAQQITGIPDKPCSDHQICCGATDGGVCREYDDRIHALTINVCVKGTKLHRTQNYRNQEAESGGNVRE